MNFVNYKAKQKTKITKTLKKEETKMNLNFMCVCVSIMFLPGCNEL